MAALWFPLWATGASEKRLENPRVRNIEVEGRGDKSRLDPPAAFGSQRNKCNIMENACGGVACSFTHKRTKKL